jgi:hypothetical protein
MCATFCLGTAFVRPDVLCHFSKFPMLLDGARAFGAASTDAAMAFQGL